jgi:hypothetical protein
MEPLTCVLVRPAVRSAVRRFTARPCAVPCWPPDGPQWRRGHRRGGRCRAGMRCSLREPPRHWAGFLSRTKRPITRNLSAGRSGGSRRDVSMMSPRRLCDLAGVDHQRFGVQPTWPPRPGPPAWQLTRVLSHVSTAEPCRRAWRTVHPSGRRTSHGAISGEHAFGCPRTTYSSGVEAGAGELGAVGGAGKRVHHAAHLGRARGCH